jgi:tRNA A-37 threonylcarbamoyl transferase component Bud32
MARINFLKTYGGMMPVKGACLPFGGKIDSGVMYDYALLAKGIPLENIKDSLTAPEKDNVKEQVRAILDGMHQQGHCHGDVQPANVIVLRKPDGSLDVSLIDPSKDRIAVGHMSNERQMEVEAAQGKRRDALAANYLM